MKCEHKGCLDDATCKAPKSRTLKSYWNFCKKHAAEYNQNWDFYSGMSQTEIEKDWEKRTFGSEINAGATRRNYRDIINDVLSGKIDPAGLYNNPRAALSFPRDIIRAFQVLGLEPGRDIKVIKATYLKLAKKHHPDKAQAKDTEKFKSISRAFQDIQKFLKD